jgi:hypothetical protein
VLLCCCVLGGLAAEVMRKRILCNCKSFDDAASSKACRSGLFGFTELEVETAMSLQYEVASRRVQNLSDPIGIAGSQAELLA